MLKIQENVDVKDYSTLKIGGQFRYFVIINSKEELLSLFEILHHDDKYKNIPIFILGGGSNMVFSDGIINVIALKIEIKGIEIINQTDEYTDIKVGSGENWDNIVNKTVEMDLQGFEALSSIPGTVGATPVQNVGAYGVEVKDSILEVEVFDINQKIIKTISNSDCKFNYRDSIFKNEAKGQYIIISVTYRLKNMGQRDIISKNHLSLLRPTVGARAHTYDFYKQYLADLPVMNYPGVREYFESKKIINPNLKQIREAIIEIRKEKLPNPKEIPNVGSFFKNPIVQNEIVDKLKIKYPNIKYFKVDEKHSKISAGWLIENAGLKGKNFGKIGTYDKNALVLINDCQASFQDLIQAKKEIIKVIKEKFDIVLEQEPETLE
jgi:UDP-N-acetylmuramate dehydrogenase